MTQSLPTKLECLDHRLLSGRLIHGHTSYAVSTRLLCCDSKCAEVDAELDRHVGDSWAVNQCPPERRLRTAHQRDLSSFGGVCGSAIALQHRWPERQCLATGSAHRGGRQLSRVEAGARQSLPGSAIRATSTDARGRVRSAESTDDLAPRPDDLPDAEGTPSPPAGPVPGTQAVREDRISASIDPPATRNTKAPTNPGPMVARASKARNL